MRKAKELMLTGKLLTGAEAKEWGLINDAAPAEELDERVERFVADLADKSPFQMAITKMAVNRGLDADPDTLMVMERLAAGVTLELQRRRRGRRRLPREARPSLDGDLSRLAQAEGGPVVSTTPAERDPGAG